jgi:hypothetical protein
MTSNAYARASQKALGYVSDAIHTHARLNALLLMGNLERWERLIASLEATTNDREEVRMAAHAAIQQWLTTLSLSAHVPAPPRLEQRDRLQRLLGTVVASNLRARLEDVLRA